MKSIILSIILIFMLSGCSSADCDADSKHVAYAKQLSSMQLEKLFKDTKIFYEKKERIHYEGEIPNQFKEINIKIIRVHKGIHLRLNGCFDHWVDLVVFDKGKNQRIELWYGEGPTSAKEVLWKLTKT